MSCSASRYARSPRIDVAAHVARFRFVGEPFLLDTSSDQPRSPKLCFSSSIVATSSLAVSVSDLLRAVAFSISTSMSSNEHTPDIVALSSTDSTPPSLKGSAMLKHDSPIFTRTFSTATPLLLSRACSASSLHGWGLSWLVHGRNDSRFKLGGYGRPANAFPRLGPLEPGGDVHRLYENVSRAARDIKATELSNRFSIPCSRLARWSQIGEPCLRPDIGEPPSLLLKPLHRGFFRPPLSVRAAPQPVLSCLLSGCVRVFRHSGAVRQAATAAVACHAGGGRWSLKDVPVVSAQVCRSPKKSLVKIGEPSHTRRFASERGEFSPNGSQSGYSARVV